MVEGGRADVGIRPYADPPLPSVGDDAHIVPPHDLAVRSLTGKYMICPLAFCCETATMVIAKNERR